MICGIGPSMRALKERQSLTKNMLAGETPEKLMPELEEAVDAEPSLNVWGIHFFAFAAPRETVGRFANHRGGVTGRRR